ncbi:MAG: TonB-dependent receptor [Cyclobacteriaceae bacterium]
MGNQIILNQSIISQLNNGILYPKIQEIIVSGKVTSQDGMSLPGVTILVKGTSLGTVTDVNGEYSLEIPEGNEVVLLFSSIGFVSQEVRVSGRSIIDLVLEEDVQSLNEVVVVGYGEQKKTSVTAAVSSLDGKDIANVPIANMSNALGGRIPGLIVRQTSGEPGRDANNIYIRGVASTGSTQPLLIVDGIPRDFQNLDPNTIESLTVLKDAAAVAPYGVAGANGVILVTTKRGKSGVPTITYNGYLGFQNPTVLPELPTAYEYASLKNAASVNVGGEPLYNEYNLQKFQDGSDPDGHPNHNVYDELFDTNTPLNSHNIELSGGAERVKYYASVGYQHQAGIWEPTHQKRFNYSMNIDADVTKTTKISFGINGREQTNNAPPISTGRLFELVHYASPIRPLLFSNGESGDYIWNNVHGSGSSQTNISQLYTQLSLEQDLSFIPGLKAKGTIAFDPTNRRNKAFRTPSHLWSVDTTQTPYVFIDGIFEQTKPSLSQSMDYAKQLTYQASLSYSGMFGKNHIGGLVLFEAKSNDALGFGATRRNYNLFVDELSMGSSSQADITNYGTSSSARQMGVVYRATYNYSEKYLFEASGRYDGSYFFAPENRFGFFPAFSVGWRLSEEEFMQNIRGVNNLKIRGSYGEVGSLAGSPFQYLSLYNVSGPVAVLDGEAVQGASEGIESNPNITWERAKKSNIGLEVILWKGLLQIEADYFYEKRSNMLTNPTVVVPVEYGVGLSQVNAGVMDNRGFDFLINSDYSFSNEFQVSLGGNFTFAKNRLLEVFETSTTYNNPNRRRTGRPLGTRFGYESIGYFQVEDFDENGNLLDGIAIQPWGEVFPGDVRYNDLNNDGKIDNDDRTMIGVADIPQIIYGIFSNITYKRFALDLLFQGAGKTNIYGPSGYWHPFNNGRGAYKSNLDYWTPENPNASHTRITPSPTANNNQTSSYLMFNSRYLRLKNINLAYSVPEVLSRKVGVQNAKVFISGQNLLTFTPIINYDPEIINSQALDYPQQRVISAGINLTIY